jgi:hypothetical protein
MGFTIPPIIPYVLGAILIIFGILRVKYLAAPRLPKAEDGEEQDVKPVRGRDQRRHLRMGIIWIGMGLFLVFSTYLQLRQQG